MDNRFWSLLSIVGQIGFIVAIPLVVFALAGLWLDRRLNTLPLFLISGMLLALVISGVAIYRMIKSIENPKSKIQNSK